MPERTTRRTAHRPRSANNRAARSAAGDDKSRGRRAPRSQAPISKSGVPITDQLADELAREAEEGYDLSRGRRVGRKSLAGTVGRSPRLNFRTTADLYERAAARAQREGKTISQIAREALEKFVK
jgi:hypothetical protein